MGRFGESENRGVLPQFVPTMVVKERLSESNLLYYSGYEKDNYCGTGQLTHIPKEGTKCPKKTVDENHNETCDYLSPLVTSHQNQSKPLVSNSQKKLADNTLAVMNWISAKGLYVTNWFGYGYDYLNDLMPKKELSIKEQKFPKPHLWILLFTYFVYAWLAVMACFVEILRWFGLVKHCSHHEDPRMKDFVNLYTDFEAFFARNMYGYAKDVWNRPISSAPDATFDVVDRVSQDFGWTVEFPGTTTKAINLASYNYLGFGQNTGPWIEEAAQSIRQYGIGICSSRQEIGNQKIHKQLEQLIAEYLGVEDAMCFPMGFSTNSMNIPCFASKGSLVLSDQLNHSSLILGCRLSGATIRTFKHNDLQDLENKMIDAIKHGHPQTKKPFKKILICLEGIYSMEGTICQLPEIIALKKRYKAYLYLDEAHSMGALGPNGRGVCDYFGCDPRDIDILMGTFSKSFASAGGYIAGRKEMIAHLRVSSHNSCYGGSMSAPLVQQVISIVTILMGKDRTNDGMTRVQQLARNTIYFRRRLKQLGFIIYGDDTAPVVPMMIYDPLKLITFSRQLLARNVGVVVVGFPATPLLLARARFCISAAHTKEILDRALEAIDAVGSEQGAKFARRRYRPDKVIQY